MDNCESIYEFTSQFENFYKFNKYCSYSTLVLFGTLILGSITWIHKDRLAFKGTNDWDLL